MTSTAGCGSLLINGSQVDTSRISLLVYRLLTSLASGSRRYSRMRVVRRRQNTGDVRAIVKRLHRAARIEQPSARPNSATVCQESSAITMAATRSTAVMLRPRQDHDPRRLPCNRTPTFQRDATTSAAPPPLVPTVRLCSRIDSGARTSRTPAAASDTTAATKTGCACPLAAHSR